MCICLPQVYCHLAIHIYVMAGSARFVRFSFENITINIGNHHLKLTESCLVRLV